MERQKPDDWPGLANVSLVKIEGYIKWINDQPDRRQRLLGLSTQLPTRQDWEAFVKEQKTPSMAAAILRQELASAVSTDRQPGMPVVRSNLKLQRLACWNDLLPSPGLRKQTAKMLADQQVHIKELHDAGRYKAAKWHVACTYGLWLWYVVMRPLFSLAKNLRGKVGGA